MLYIPNIDEIVKRRILIGLSQHQASIQAGFGSCTINRIENGKSTQIHSSRATAIAKALHCKVDDIFTEVRK